MVADAVVIATVAKVDADTTSKKEVADTTKVVAAVVVTKHVPA